MPNRKPRRKSDRKTQPLMSGIPLRGGIPKPLRIVHLAPHTYLAIAVREGDHDVKNLVTLLAAHAYLNTTKTGSVVTLANGQRIELDHRDGELTAARVRKGRASKGGDRRA